MKTTKLLIQLLILGWISGLAPYLHAAPQYHYYTTGQGNGSQAVAINDNGQAVVNFNDRAYLWTLSGGLTDLGDLGGGKSYGYGINNQGQIVGESFVNPTTSHAFLWSSGNMQDLGGLSGGVRSIAASINNLGKVVGGTLFADSTMSPFTWTVSGGLQPLNLQGGLAYKIMDDGRMAGQNNNRAWLWNSPGAGQNLGTLPAPFNGNSEAHDINQNGQVVGWAMMQNPPGGNASHAFSWTQSGGIKDLGTMGGTYSRAFAINSQGYIVGWSDTADGFTRGCLWTPDGNKLNLDTLVINKPLDVQVGDAYGINAKGIIVGKGNGSRPAYMLVPQNAGFLPGILQLLQ